MAEEHQDTLACQAETREECDVHAHWFQRPPELRPLHELADTGLLWLINASVFHPRGLALALNLNPESPEDEGWVLLKAEEGQPYMFEDTPEIHDRYRKAIETLMEAQHG